MADETPPPYGDPWSNTVPVPAQPPVPAPLPVPLPVTAPLLGPDPVIVQIGEIQVSSTTVYTPAGQFPLKGSQWTVTDQWIAEQKIPQYAIVLAIVGFFCLTVLSLLFLLIKETTYTGTVVVQVHSGPHHYVSRVPATNQAYVQYVYQQVNYVRSLAAL